MKYKIAASFSVTLVDDVEADSVEEAREKAEDLDWLGVWLHDPPRGPDDTEPYSVEVDLACE